MNFFGITIKNHTDKRGPRSRLAPENYFVALNNLFPKSMKSFMNLNILDLKNVLKNNC